MKKVNIILSAVLIGFGIFYAYLTAELPERNLPNTLGSDFMPWVLVGCLFLLSALLLIRTVWGGSPENFESSISQKEAFGVIYLTACVFAYVKLMSLIGFILATPIFLALLMLITGSRKWKEIVIVSILATFGIYLLFQKIFQVILPRGELF
ncbi:MAG: tripartite tricarboxylate transporter TctB family protein [Desulfobacterales bacterium]|jgi:putative tricarboxylic transport membrane protein